MKLDAFKEDLDVVKPFADRLLVRLREKLGREITLDEVEIEITVKSPIFRPTIDPTGEASVRVRRMLEDMNK